MYDYKTWFLSIGINHRRAARLGLERSLVYVSGQPYLLRWIVYLLGITLRLHTFYRGDDDRAPHQHPWWFITFPFHDYIEAVYERGHFVKYNVVKAWRFHFRPANYEHVVMGAVDQDCVLHVPPKPFRSFCISGFATNNWGFYPKPDLFIPHKQFDEYWRSK